MAVEVLDMTDLANSFRQQGQDVGKLDFSKAMKNGAILARSAMQQGFNRSTSPDGLPWAPLKHKRPRGGTLPLLDTGRLRASLTQEVKPKEFTVGTALLQAAIHQFGGKVTPKQGKYLAIPLTRKAQLAGSPRRYSGKLGVKFGKKGGLMFEKKGKNEIGVYALVKSVTIPARPFLGFSREVEERCIRLILDTVENQLRKR